MPCLEPCLGDISSLTVNQQLNHSITHVLPRSYWLIVDLPGGAGQYTGSWCTGPKLNPHCTKLSSLDFFNLFSWSGLQVRVVCKSQVPSGTLVVWNTPWYLTKSWSTFVIVFQKEGRPDPDMESFLTLEFLWAHAGHQTAPWASVKSHTTHFCYCYYLTVVQKVAHLFSQWHMEVPYVNRDWPSMWLFVVKRITVRCITTCIFVRILCWQLFL